MAQIDYQTIEADGSVGGGSVTVPDLEDLSQARKIVQDAASGAVDCDVVAVHLGDGRDLVREDEDAWDL